MVVDVSMKVIVRNWEVDIPGQQFYINLLVQCADTVCSSFIIILSTILQITISFQ